MIHPPEGTGFLDGNHVRRLLDDAHHRVVTGRITTEGAKVIIAQRKTPLAQPDFLFNIENAVCQLLSILSRSPQNMQRQTFGRFFTDTRKFGDMPDQILY
jgi:hypothetical protein